MMNSIVVGILHRDAFYVKAFMSVDALDHSGYTVKAFGACGAECIKDADVCISFEQEPFDERQDCEKSFTPGCGPYAGVSAVLREAKAFVFDRRIVKRVSSAKNLETLPFTRKGLVCVYACTGGIGTSVSAIGIGREIARYRGERTMYLSLEDVEDAGLFPERARAMHAGETVYRYLRILNGEAATAEAFERLFSAAAARDEYGMYRIAPDDCLNRLAGFQPEELLIFIRRVFTALHLQRLVLDFGTRIHHLSGFISLLEPDEAYLVEVYSEDESCIRKRKSVFNIVKTSYEAIFPNCEEDIQKTGGRTEVGLANAFGLSVKEVCDHITGESA